MSRIVSVWLRSWPVARLLRAQAKPASSTQAELVDPRRPLVLVAPGQGGPRVIARNPAAGREGIAVGELLTSARSKALDLQSRPADPAADAAALRALALWGLRYTPLVAAWGAENGADGFFLDITGCAHLLGGEEALLADLAARLRGFGLRARLAIADAPGTAWAVARYGAAETAIVPAGGEATAIADLPPEALRLGEETPVLLRRLGFRRIGDLIRQPRAPLAARFGAHLMVRLDQVLARGSEPLSPLSPLPIYRAHAGFLDAITTQDHVVVVATRLLSALAGELERDGVGIRTLRLLLFRLDGGVLSLDLGLAAPSRDATHIARLIALRLERLPGGLEADFGFEAAGLHVLTVEPMAERQTALPDIGQADTPTDLARLVDKLTQRLGPRSVRRLHPRQSHIPERAVRARPALEPPEGIWPCATQRPVRPLLLLAKPEAVDRVVAEAPEGPPRRFLWRGITHHVVHAEGPERIAPEWWPQRGGARTRDYYVAEDTTGRRFWLYRAGLRGPGGAPAPWFLHGVFP